MIIFRVSAILLLNTVLACQGNRTEPKAPTALSADQFANSDAEPEAADGKEHRPASVKGTEIKALVLDEKTINGRAELRIAMTIHYNGVQVGSDPGRFHVSFTASAFGNANVSSRDDASSGDYDRIVTVQGDSVRVIRDELSKIGIYVTIVDLRKNSSASVNTTLASALANSPDAGRALSLSTSSATE